METTYQWEIMNLHPQKSLDGLSDVISAITYVYRGTREDGVNAFVTGKLNLPAPNTESFIDYGNINQETIISWLENSLDIIEFKTEIQNRIDNDSIQFVTEYNLPLPWATVTTPNNPSI
jgi:hypothetical protein